jgi:hypothetical protein
MTFRPLAPAETARFAAQCRYLRVTLGSTPGGNLLNICQHIVREGRSCVGPFLDDTPTDCGLWERSPRFDERGVPIPNYKG